ncbi:MAG: asparaginase domain-containing protein, partial [Nocardioidaceae bacterium]
MTDARPVYLVTTGGTVGSRGRHVEDLVDYAAGGLRVGAAEMLESLPHSAAVKVAGTCALGPYDSNAIGPAEWAVIREAVLQASEGGRRGVVLTHGTASLE